MGNFWKSRLRKGISIVAAMVLLLNTVLPTVPVFATEEVTNDWEYIYNEATWNESFSSGILVDYYEWADTVGSKPYKEDLRCGDHAAGWNDARNAVGEEPQQDGKALDENGYFIYDGCERSWLGAKNAPEAKYPWVAVELPKPFEGTIKLVYDGGAPYYYPGEHETKTFTRGFYIESVVTMFGDEYLIKGSEISTFDPTKLEVTLIPVEYAAQIGDDKYETLQAAINAAGDESEIVVLNDITNEHISITNKNLILNLSGKTINPSTAGTVIDINNSTVTITGEGTVKNSNDGSYLTVAAHEGADVTIMNGTYESVSLGNTALIYAYNGATITIKDGTFKGAKATNPEDKDGKVIYAGASDNVAAERDNYGYLVIEGGSFEGRMSDSNWGHYEIKGGTFDRNEVAHYEDDVNGDSQNTHTTITLEEAGFLADGYEAVENAGKWTVGCGPEVDETTYPLEECPENGTCTAFTGYTAENNACTEVVRYKLDECGPEVDETTYPLEECPENGTCTAFTGYTAENNACTEVVRYKLDECGPEVDETTYPLEECPENGTCTAFTGYTAENNACTEVVRYKLDECSEGFHEDNGLCIADAQEDVEELLVPDPGTTVSAGAVDDVSLDNAEAIDTGFVASDYEGVTMPQVIIQQKTDDAALKEEGTSESALENTLTSDFVADTGKVADMQGILDIQLIYLDGSGNATPLGNVAFSDPVKIMIPVKTGANVQVRVKHEGDASYGTVGLTLDSTATCNPDGTVAEESKAYTGGDVTVANGKAEIYTCSASSFVAYTETEKQSSTPSSSSSGGGGGGGGGSSKASTGNVSTGSVNTGDVVASTGDSVDADITTGAEEGANEENKTISVEEEQAAVAKFGQEQIDAYKRALENGITTMKTVEVARLDEPLTRAELAKMMVVYIQKVLKQDPIITGDVSYSDVKEDLGDLYGYIKLAYQYQIMGINADGTPIELFNPYGIVSRGEYATVFSRVLFGSKFNKDGEDFYTNHLEALKTAGILTNTTPSIQEMRGWVMLMMYRSSQNGEAIEKVANSTEETADETKADETANEETATDETKTETNEETKAEETTNAGTTTGDITEAPATEETGETTAAENTDTTAETATGNVAEVDTGAVAETTTGDTASS